MIAVIINQPIIDFVSDAYVNGAFRRISRADVLGRWAVFLFYPQDFSQLCPQELADMADYYPKMQALGVEVYAVSTDSHLVHRAWHSASVLVNRVRYPMLGDKSGDIARGFGVLDVKSHQALRASFVVDPTGIIQLAEIHNIGIRRSAQEMLRKVKAAKDAYNAEPVLCDSACQVAYLVPPPILDLADKL